MWRDALSADVRSLRIAAASSGDSTRHARVRAPRRWSAIVFLAVLACGTLAAATPVTLKVRVKSTIIEMPSGPVCCRSTGGRMQHLPVRRRHQGDGGRGPFLCAEPARPACRARLRSLLHHALPASGSRCGNAAPGIARCADLRRSAVVRRQTGIRVLLPPMRRDHGRCWGGVGRSARAVPAESRGPVLPAAGHGRVALERPGGRDRSGASPIAIARAGGDGRHRHRAAHGLGAGAGAGAGRQCRAGADIGEFVPFRHRPCAGLQHGAQRSLVGGAGGRATEVRGRGGRPRSRDVPARRRPDGRRGSQLSRDSGVLLSGHGHSG